jgi:hypothetical protein
VLTARSARARRVARDNAAKRAKAAAKNAQAIDIADDQYRRKHLYQSSFRNPCVMHSMRVQAHRCWSAMSEMAVRGL